MTSKGFKKFIRKEKARLRREISDPNELKQRFTELYSSVKQKGIDSSN